MNSFFKKLGKYIENKRLFITIIAVILIAVSALGATKLAVAFDNSTFVSSNSQVYKDYDKFTKYFSSDVIVVLVSGENTSQLLQSKNLSSMETIENQLSATPGVISVIDPPFTSNRRWLSNLELPYYRWMTG